MMIEALSASTLSDIKRRWELETVCRKQQATIERILTAVTTLQFQQRDIFGYLVHARQAAVTAAAPWSLVPST